MATAIISGIIAILSFIIVYATRNSKYVPEGWLVCATMGNPNLLRYLIFMVGIIALIICGFAFASIV